MKCTLDKHQTSLGANHVVACVASVFFRFRSKELGTRVKDRAKNAASKRAGRGLGGGRKKGRKALVPFFARPKPKIPFLVFPRSFFAPKLYGNACYEG